MDVIRIEPHCNQNCLFCGADPENTDDYTRSFSQLKSLIDNSNKNEIIEISGGEPTLSPLLPKVLAYAQKKNKVVSLQTNGMRFADAKFARLMYKVGLRKAFVSLHASDARLSDALTRTPGGFELTVAGVRNLIDAGVKVSLNCVICASNKRRLQQYVQFVHDRFGSGLTVVFSFINPFHNAWKTPKLIPRISDVIDELHAALVLGEKLGLDMHIPDICGIPLCFLRGKEKFADKYLAILMSWPFEQHRDKSLMPPCEDCVWKKDCDGQWNRYIELHGYGEHHPVRKYPKEFLERKTKIDPKPGESLEETSLLVGSGCPNNCIFCNEGGRHTTRQSMTLEEAEILLKKTTPHHVFLSSGEPTTCKNLPEYAALCKNNNVAHVTLVTNGSGLLDQQYTRGLLENGVDEIRISIHGPDAQTHDAQTRRDGSFDEIVDACEILNNEKRNGMEFRLVALVVINKFNLDKLSATIDKLIQLGFDRIGLGVVEPVRNAAQHFDEVVPRYATVAKRLAELFRYIDGRNIDINVDNLPACMINGSPISTGKRSIIRTIDSEGVEDLMVMTASRGKSFGPPCQNCLSQKSCEGVWNDYVSHFGWEEFKPIS